MLLVLDCLLHSLKAEFAQKNKEKRVRHEYYWSVNSTKVDFVIDRHNSDGF